MKKAFIRIVWILLAFVVIAGTGYFYLRYQTKQASPEAIVEYKEDGMDVQVVYYRPSKRGRVIFGDLVPYGETWRTGANEATTFSTASDILVNGKLLPAGKYTMWTIPNPNEWLIIFNTHNYNWGVDASGRASRNPQFDMLTVASIPSFQGTVQDTFTISVNDHLMNFRWDQISVDVLLEQGER